jgi:hypothetical protein
LTAGEVAVNLADRRLFVGGTNGTNVVFLDQTSSVTTVNGTTGPVGLTGTGAILFAQSGKTGTFNARLATTSLTGVASFNTNDFVVGSTGHVGLGSTVARTNASNTFIASQTINAGTPTLTIDDSVKIATFGTQNISWYDDTSSYTQILQSNVVGPAGSTVNMPSSSGTLALVDGTVSRVNGATGPVTITGAGAVLFTQTGRTGSFDARLATTSLTGVASFNTNDFVVGSTGHVGLTGTIARTNASQTFSNTQTFNTIEITGGYIRSDQGYRIGTNAINAQTGTSYTLTGTDNGKIVTFSNAATTTVTIPAGLDTGFNCTVIQLGAGQVGFTAPSGVTMQSYGNQFKLIGQHASATVLEHSTNLVNISGNLIV